MKSDPGFAAFLEANALAREQMGIGDSPDQWESSPFNWIRSLPPRSRGKVGELIASAWLEDLGCEVRRSAGSYYDRLVDSRRVEIKFSTLWKSGAYAFEQIRPAQDYEFVLALGVSPHSASIWIIPKDVAIAHAVPQHGGSAGKDTLWLQIVAAQPPSWMSEFGGSLANAERLARALRTR